MTIDEYIFAYPALILHQIRATIRDATPAAQLLEQYQSIPLRFVDIELSESILIAQQYNIYAYDAYLLRCAEKYRCPLLTLDEALRHHARAHGLATLEVV